ncbi:MAG: hypothetical protein FJY65_10090, partial [Calditrichaeota bacterium]|nr:hypothetical protein [Calditrichota bacterium]
MPRLTASLALAGMCLLAAGASLHARIIEVPDHQRTIQNAYDVSRPGDTILVHPGEYTCAITIDHDLTLAGEYLLTGDTSTVEETILRNEGSPIIQIGGVLVNFYLRGLSLRNARAGLIPAQNGQGAGTIEISQCCFDTLSQ